MAIVSQMTLTYGADDSKSWEPSSATGIYSNGSINFVNNSPTMGACQFYLKDADGNTISDYRNGEGLIESTSTITKTLAELFPGRTLAGYYLYQTYSGPLSLLISDQYTACAGPSWCSLDKELSREAVTLRWGEGTPGTNNPIDHYEVWRAEMESPDAAYPEDWELVGSTGELSMSVDPPETVGRYYLYSVWAVGANYHENADSEWCDSSNLLRRKWDAFGAWTDQTLTAGVSSIRAVHLTQLQERIAVIRAFYGLSAYAFTAVTARKTKIATWAALIGELRSAVDGITTNHASWNTLEAGKPRIAHITQLRDIIDNM